MPYTARTHQLSQSLLYHVYNRANGRSEIFHDSEDYQKFLSLLSGYSKEHDFSAYHWVFMPNHYHLLLELDNPERLSSIMAGLARAYVYYYHHKYQSSGHLWQGRFKSQPIEKEHYLLSCGRYIERNPVKAKMVDFAEDYPYSSAAFYVYGKQDSITTEDPAYETFGKEPTQQRRSYKEFLEAFDSQDDELFEKMEDPQGSQEFLKRLIKEKGLLLPRRRGRARK